MSNASLKFLKKIIQEKVKEVPRIEYRESITYVPKIITKEKIVEIPEIEYREIPIEKIVEVPEVREEVLIREIAVPRYVEVPVPVIKNVEIEQEVERNVPVPVQCVTTAKYELPQIEPRYEKVPVPIYAPRFVEVPVPVEQLDETSHEMAQQLLQEVTNVCSHPYPSLCEIERIAERAKNFQPDVETDPEKIQEGLQRSVADRNGHVTRARPSRR
eukprot:Polyplicarium_translucidae@DN1773_c0_g1_i2.p2